MAYKRSHSKPQSTAEKSWTANINISDFYQDKKREGKKCLNSDVCRLTDRFSNTKLVIDAAVLHVRHPNTRNQSFLKREYFLAGVQKVLRSFVLQCHRRNVSTSCSSLNEDNENNLYEIGPFNNTDTRFGLNQAFLMVPSLQFDPNTSHNLEILRATQ